MMGQRRMFSKDIVRSDSFLDLPLSAQCLYFQLGMDTDDRGYIPNGKSIIRLIGANQGDLEMLIQKRFILVRNGCLLLQKHFKANNYIRPDRFHETNYTEDLCQLFYDENGNYTETETDIKVLGNQVVGKCPTEDKISKVKISKDKIEIKLDKTRYKQNELLQMLLNSQYISIIELEDISYDDFLDDLVDTYGYVDTKIKLKYFIDETCPLNKLGKHEYCRTDIDDKFNYLRKSLINSFNRPTK